MHVSNLTATSGGFPVLFCNQVGNYFSLGCEDLSITYTFKIATIYKLQRLCTCVVKAYGDAE